MVRSFLGSHVGILRSFSSVFLVCLFFFSLLLPTRLSAQGNTLVAPDGSVDWDRYYTAAETEQILREFHDLFPGLTELYSIGKSFQGTGPAMW